MFLPIVLSFIASTFALPTLELPVPPELFVVVTSEKEVDIIQSNTEASFINTNEHIDTIENQSNSNEKNEEERRIFEEERRIIDEEKRMIEEKRLIDEEANKIIEEEKKFIEEEEKRIIEEQEERLIEEKQIMEEEQERKIILPTLPSPPELKPIDESIFTTFLKANKLEDSQDASNDEKPYIFMWKLPRIIFPGRYIIDNIYGPHITLGA